MKFTHNFFLKFMKRFYISFSCVTFHFLLQPFWNEYVFHVSFKLFLIHRLKYVDNLVIIARFINIPIDKETITFNSRIRFCQWFPIYILIYEVDFRLRQCIISKNLKHDMENFFFFFNYLETYRNQIWFCLLIQKLQEG